MATLEDSVVVDASLAETWDAYFDPAGWAAWVDGFHTVVESAGYPQAGGTLRWRSTPAGRGAVTARVLEHVGRRLHRVVCTDPAMAGELETTFSIAGGGTRVGQRLTYGLVQRGPIALLASVFFIRPQVRGSVRRTLEALKQYVPA